MWGNKADGNSVPSITGCGGLNILYLTIPLPGISRGNTRNVHPNLALKMPANSFIQQTVIMLGMGWGIFKYK